MVYDTGAVYSSNPWARTAGPTAEMTQGYNWEGAPSALRGALLSLNALTGFEAITDFEMLGSYLTDITINLEAGPQSRSLRPIETGDDDPVGDNKVTADDILQQIVQQLRPEERTALNLPQDPRVQDAIERNEKNPFAFFEAGYRPQDEESGAPLYRAMGITVNPVMLQASTLPLYYKIEGAVGDLVRKGVLTADGVDYAVLAKLRGEGLAQEIFLQNKETLTPRLQDAPPASRLEESLKILGLAPQPAKTDLDARIGFDLMSASVLTDYGRRAIREGQKPNTVHKLLAKAEDIVGRVRTSVEFAPDPQQAVLNAVVTRQSQSQLVDPGVIEIVAELGLAGNAANLTEALGWPASRNEAKRVFEETVQPAIDELATWMQQEFGLRIESTLKPGGVETFEGQPSLDGEVHVVAPGRLGIGIALRNLHLDGLRWRDQAGIFSTGRSQLLGRRSELLAAKEVMLAIGNELAKYKTEELYDVHAVDTGDHSKAVSAASNAGDAEFLQLNFTPREGAPAQEFSIQLRLREPGKRQPRSIDDVLSELRKKLNFS